MLSAVGLVASGVAALVHIYIWVLESLTWTSPRTRAVFGIRTAEEAETLRKLAFNQGFYNLFLAVMALAGIVLYVAGESVVGATLIYAGAGSMFLAAVVLQLSNRAMIRAALIQGLPPLIGLIALTVDLLT